jgi:hypothetical protein
MIRVTTDTRRLCLLKGGERYVFIFDDRHRIELLRTFGRFAMRKDLSFSWYDAAVLSQKAREMR